MIYIRIRELREDNDLKQVDLAKLLNISQAAYSKYELGQRSIPIEVLVTLANFYHTSVDYLIGKSNKK